MFANITREVAQRHTFNLPTTHVMFGIYPRDVWHVSTGCLAFIHVMFGIYPRDVCGRYRLFLSYFIVVLNKSSFFILH